MITGVGRQNVAATANNRKTTETRRALDQKTLEDLATAMHGEAFAYAKYVLYAEHARKSGNKELADLFEKTAHTERFEHFAEEAQLAGLVGSDTDNLRDAIEGESYEVDAMYLEFAQRAKAAGDSSAAARFEEIRHDEMGHRDAFKIALAKLAS
jgi:rubrerythrin